MASNLLGNDSLSLSLSQPIHPNNDVLQSQITKPKLRLTHHVRQSLCLLSSERACERECELEMGRGRSGFAALLLWLASPRGGYTRCLGSPGEHIARARRPAVLVRERRANSGPHTMCRCHKGLFVSREWGHLSSPPANKCSHSLPSSIFFVLPCKPQQKWKREGSGETLNNSPKQKNCIKDSFALILLSDKRESFFVVWRRKNRMQSIFSLAQPTKMGQKDQCKLCHGYQAGKSQNCSFAPY